MNAAFPVANSQSQKVCRIRSMQMDVCVHVHARLRRTDQHQMRQVLSLLPKAEHKNKQVAAQMDITAFFSYEMHN